MFQHFMGIKSHTRAELGRDGGMDGWMDGWMGEEQRNGTPPDFCAAWCELGENRRPLCVFLFLSFFLRQKRTPQYCMLHHQQI